MFPSNLGFVCVCGFFFPHYFSPKKVKPVFLGYKLYSCISKEFLYKIQENFTTWHGIFYRSMTPLCIIYAKEVGRESMNKGWEVFIDCYLVTQYGLVNVFFSSWLIFDLFELELIISRLWLNFISDIFGYITGEDFILLILCVEDMEAVHDHQQIQEDQQVNQNSQNPILDVAPPATPVVPQEQQPQVPQEAPLTAENLTDIINQAVSGAISHAIGGVKTYVDGQIQNQKLAQESPSIEVKKLQAKKTVQRFKDNEEQVNFNTSVIESIHKAKKVIPSGSGAT